MLHLKTGIANFEGQSLNGHHNHSLDRGVADPLGLIHFKKTPEAGDSMASEDKPFSAYQSRDDFGLDLMARYAEIISTELINGKVLKMMIVRHADIGGFTASFKTDVFDNIKFRHHLKVLISSEDYPTTFQVEINQHYCK